MRIYYKIPDSDNHIQNRIVGLLYENFKLRMEIALAPVKALLDKHDGMILIERQEEAIELRYEGLPEEIVLIIRYLLAQMKEKQKINF